MRPTDPAAVRAYRERLASLARRYGVEFPEPGDQTARALGNRTVASGPGGADDDAWQAQVAALLDPRFTQTVVTRAFSGRWARGLRNGFTAAYSDVAPAVYPAVNRLTGVLRAAAARSGDLDNLSLWAGTGWRHTPTGSVARIMDGLLS
ncbi:nitronate monooxygenase [Actinomyces sp.]|uniref:nitronate monooxygenase n=1 Tax=Actinomyces sp. TaxID=29317 RepID=UPI0026DB8246|nr:nitronate monooxygenase [Actinomyces sp.]MDO4899157.1 nitronate monooxygenase [Actinomyces sp.]